MFYFFHCSGTKSGASKACRQGASDDLSPTFAVGEMGLNDVTSKLSGCTVPLPLLVGLLLRQKLVKKSDKNWSTTHPNQPLRIDRGVDYLLSTFCHFHQYSPCSGHTVAIAMLEGSINF